MMSDNYQNTRPNPDLSPRIVQDVAERIAQNVGQVILGKRNEIRLAILGLLCRGHLLLEDVPGVGKTMMARALAKSIGGSFNRIQFTPDMLPSDITGVSVFNQQTQTFVFHKGPLMSQIVLADEINRGTPKTQSALLEAMEERQITVDGTTYNMEVPFMIIATQNPIEYEGTFPLPEAQLDRFFLRIEMGYPRPEEELTILSAQQIQHPIQNIQQSVYIEELIQAQQAVTRVYAAEEIKQYIVSIIDSTRKHPDIRLGSSPRGSLALFRASQARAAMAGRDYVLPDDVKVLAEVTLSHRIILGSSARINSISEASLIRSIVERTPVPGASVR